MTKDCSAEPRDSSGFDSGNVSDPIPKELLEYLHNSIGANLRSVAHYDRDTAVIETNDDLDDQHPADATAEIVLDEDATVARSSGLTNTWPSDCPSVG